MFFEERLAEKWKIGKELIHGLIYLYYRVASDFCSFTLDLKVFFFNYDKFKVINHHGDFWTNNMMFRYDERNQPVQSIMVRKISMFIVSSLEIWNWQNVLVGWFSSVLLLFTRHGPCLYFFTTSLTEDVYNNKLDYLSRNSDKGDGSTWMQNQSTFNEWNASNVEKICHLWIINNYSIVN